jgi:hypothetical protein
MGQDLSETTLNSPTGNWSLPAVGIHAWTSGDNREKKFTYFWAVSTVELDPTLDYRICNHGEVAVDWTPMAKTAEVFAKTKFRDEDSDPEDTNLVGGAERLAAGIYDLELRCSPGGKPHLLLGICFEVTTRTAANGGWRIKASQQ